MIARNIREAVINLLATKQRSLLALLGIVIGTGSVIAMLNIGAIVEEAVLRQFRDMGTNTLALSFRQEGPAVQPFQIDQLPATVPGLAAAVPMMSGYTALRRGGVTLDAAVLGVPGTFAGLARLAAAEGRFIAELDRHEAFGVLGATLAADLSRGGRPVAVGDVILVNGVGITVVGLLRPKPANDLIGVRFDDSLFVSLAAARRLFDNVGIDRAMLFVAPSFAPAEVALRVGDHFAGLRIKTTIRSAEELIAMMQTQSRLFSRLLGAIGCISLLVGGIGVMNVMLVSVSERRREIGIRLAVGARRADIRQQFMVEGVVLAVVGGLSGTLLGLLVSYGFARMDGLNFVASPVACLLGPAVSALTGIFFSFYPANQAAKLDPIQALQAE